MFNRSLSIAGSAIIIDQLTKGWVQSLFIYKEAHAFHLTPFLNLYPTWNKGVSFSLFSSFQAPLLIAITGALACCLLMLCWHNRIRILSWSYGLILGGALGNLIDRIRFGRVFDFIDFHLYNWHFYTFNGADVFISLGAGLLIVEVFILSPNR